MAKKNGQVCCILGVCCRSKADAERALAELLVIDLGCSEDEAQRHARWTLQQFDLAPAGTLGRYAEAIAAMARAHPES